jgi:hypothetical protein
VEIAVSDQAGTLNEPVGKGRFAVIYVGDDAEITDSFGLQVGRSLRHSGL